MQQAITDVCGIIGLHKISDGGKVPVMHDVRHENRVLPFIVPTKKYRAALIIGKPPIGPDNEWLELPTAIASRLLCVSACTLIVKSVPPEPSKPYPRLPDVGPLATPGSISIVPPIELLIVGDSAPGP